MTSDGDSHYTMSPSSRRDDDELSPADAERLLAGHGAARGAPAELYALARILDVAAGPASERELDGEMTAVAGFLLATGRSRRRPRVPRRPGIPKVTVLAAAVSVAAVLAICGAAAGNELPTPIQQIAHVTFGAPEPRNTAPRGPQAPSAPAAPSPSSAAATTVSPPPRIPPGQAKKLSASPPAPPSPAAKPAPHGNAKGHDKATSIPLPTVQVTLP